MVSSEVPPFNLSVVDSSEEDDWGEPSGKHGNLDNLVMLVETVEIQVWITLMLCRGKWIKKQRFYNF